MNQERTLVLEMLAAGKIDVAQADELLESLEPPATSAQPASLATPTPPPLHLSPEQVLELKNHDIDARFIRSVQGLGLGTLTFDDILELGVHGISPKTIREMRENFPDINAEQIIEFGIHGVSVKFIREMRDLFPDIDPEQIGELYVHGVDANYLRELREANLLTLDPDAIIQLKEERE